MFRATSLLLLTSCATIMEKAYIPVTLDADEKGVTYFASGRRLQKHGRSTQTMINQRRYQFFEGRKRGCDVAIAVLERRISGWFLVTFLFPYFLPIDIYTGAMWVAAKTRYNVTPDC